jgi:hypothetical protein
MLLYRFDEVKSYPILESKTTARGSTTTLVNPPAGSAEHPTLRVVVPPQSPDLAEPVVVLALPRRAVDGEPHHFFLEVCGDAGGSRVWLEAGDVTGTGLVYTWGTIGFAGWRTCATDAARPDERWSSRPPNDTNGITPPLQLYRLGFALPDGQKGMDVRLRALGVSGDVQLGIPGLA